MGRPLGISDRLGGLRAGGKILGSPEWCSGSLSSHQFPSPRGRGRPRRLVWRQEPPLQEGLLSGSHSHPSHHQLHTPGPTHLITDHRSPVIKSTISMHSSRTFTVWSRTFDVVSPDPLTFCIQSCHSCVSAPRSPPLLCSTVSKLHCSCWSLWIK